MPKVGKRIMKSSLAVFCCLLISTLRQNEGIVFYSCIAAVLCIQQDALHSKKVGYNRMKGTFVGGIIGMLFLLVEQQVPLYEVLILRYGVISLMIIVVIYGCVLLKMQSASYIACVVFLSISISHAFDVNPYIFACNRMLDTLIGIFVAFLLNGVYLPNKFKKQTLFVIVLDQEMLMKDTPFSSYTKVKLNQLIERGANIIIATDCTPSVCIPLLNEISLKLPIIAMNGALMYDVYKQEYTHCHYMDSTLVSQLLEITRGQHRNAFTHTIRNEMMHVYYDDLQNPMDTAYYHTMRKVAYQAYINHPFPSDSPALYMHLQDTQTNIKDLYEGLQQAPCYENIQVIIQECKDSVNTMCLDIYHKDTNIKQAVEEVMKMNDYTTLYVFGGSLKEEALFRFANKSYVQKQCDVQGANIEVLTAKDEHALVHKMEKLYRVRKG